MEFNTVEEKKRYEKSLRKSLNGVMAASVIQNLLMIVLTFVVVFFFTLIFLIQGGFKIGGFEYQDILKLFSLSTTVGIIVNILIYIVCLFLPFSLYLIIRRRPVKELMSFKAPKASGVVYALFITLALSVIGEIITVIILSILNKFGISPKELNIEMPSGTLNIILFIIMIAILPAFLEEFAYRGVVLGEAKRYSKSFAIVFSAFLFSLMHGTAQQIPFAFLVGLSIGYFVIKYNSIWIGIIIHFVNNGLNIVFQYLSKLFNETDFALIYLAFDVFIVIAGTVALAIYLALNDFKLKKTDGELTFSASLKNMFKSWVFYVFLILTLAILMLTFVLKE